MIDLWPDDIKALDIKPPVTILKEQGLILSKRTRNVVEGIVDAEPDNSLYKYSGM